MAADTAAWDSGAADMGAWDSGMGYETPAVDTAADMGYGSGFKHRHNRHH